MNYTIQRQFVGGVLNGQTHHIPNNRDLWEADATPVSDKITKPGEVDMKLNMVIHRYRLENDGRFHYTGMDDCPRTMKAKDEHPRYQNTITLAFSLTLERELNAALARIDYLEDQLQEAKWQAMGEDL